MWTTMQCSIKKNLGLEIKSILNDVVVSIEEEMRKIGFVAKNCCESIECYKQLKVKTLYQILKGIQMIYK